MKTINSHCYLEKAEAFYGGLCGRERRGYRKGSRGIFSLWVMDMRTPKRVFSIVENSARHSHIPLICSNTVGKPSALPCGNFIYITIRQIGGYWTQPRPSMPRYLRSSSSTFRPISLNQIPRLSSRFQEARMLATV